MIAASPLAALLPRAQELFDRLAGLGYDGVGITRDAYGKGETAALEYLAGVATESGLVTSRDAAGNLMIDLPD